MCGCCSRAASAISRLKRSTETWPDISVGQQLHDDLSAERLVRRQIYVRHDPAAQFAFERIGVAKCLLELGPEISGQRNPQGRDAGN